MYKVFNSLGFPIGLFTTRYFGFNFLIILTKGIVFHKYFETFPDILLIRNGYKIAQNVD